MLSILIVNWNTRDLLRACLASILRYPPSGEFEIIVVENASHDESAPMVASEFPLVKLITNVKNLGYAAGNNQAFAAARGDWLLTLNPDTEFRDDSLDRAVATLEQNPAFGVLGIRQIGTDGNIQSSVRGFPTPSNLLADFLGIGSAYRLANFDYSKQGPAPQPMGTFLLFRRAALESVGDAKAPFDEGFPIFFNEVDLLFRLNRAGWPCLYTPDASILHYGGESTKQVRKSMIWESHRSLIRYLRKHHSRDFGAVALPFLSLLIVAAAFFRARGYHAGFRS
ncbi:MAG: glycosyltransferase family 2 protein [Fimbriimonas sp.]